MRVNPTIHPLHPSVSQSSVTATAKWLLGIALTTALQASNAADISVAQDSFDQPVIDIVGTVVEGDLKKIQDAAALVLNRQNVFTAKPIKFHINTRDGDAFEAMRIGKFLRDILASADSYGKTLIAKDSKDEQDLSSFTPNARSREFVVLPRDAEISDRDIVRNYSAGILIFFGAVTRGHSDNSDQREGFSRQKRIPVMGIHRPNFAPESYAALSPSKAEEAYKRLELAIRTYLLQMGAPQTLLDRMFNSASNYIDLIEAQEFRTFYKKQESFLEEWLIAKCGSFGSNHALSKEEAIDYLKMEAWQIQERRRDQSPQGRPIYWLYPDPKFQEAHVDGIYKKLRTHNRHVEACQSTAVVKHQMEWASARGR